MIITDGVHITSTKSLSELHAFADRVGLKRHWFHGLRKGHPHYDVPKSTCLHCLLKEDDVEQRSPREVLKASKSIVERKECWNVKKRCDERS